MTDLPPSIDGSAEIASTAIIDEYHPSLGSRVPPTVVEAGASVGRFTIVYSSAVIRKDAAVGDHCVLSPNTVVHAGAVVGGGCRLEDGAVVGEKAVVGPGCYVGPDCGVGTGAELGPGVLLLDRTRLPGKQMPAMVGAGARVVGGAVVAGVKVGAGAVVAAGELVEDDVPDNAVWIGGRVREVVDGGTWE